jgi:CRISPR-associated protein Cas2
MPLNYPEDWWHRAFPACPHRKQPGEKTMLCLVAYDVSDPRRLAKVAKVCEDFGVRVQYSLFECLLEDADFELFWSLLLELIDDAEDRLVAYRLDSRSSKRTRSAGRMVCHEKSVCWII